MMAGTGTYIVRYGQMRFLGEFQGLDGRAHPRGQVVVIESDRGVELGEVLCPATTRTAAFLDNPAHGSILRIATDDDHQAHARLAELQERGFAACRERIAARHLDMSLVDVEAILGGDRLVFYYLAEQRVDFRELVKDLARLFHTRIEMRQIGIRDEAKLLADYGDCGQPVCCNTHLAHMPPVSMRMAKLQKTTLDPAKISGRCGRLKCCLRYEHDGYQQADRELPAVNARVATPAGDGRVLARELLPGRILVELDDRRRIVVSSPDIQAIETPGPGGRHTNSAHRHDPDTPPDSDLPWASEP